MSREPGADIRETLFGDMPLGPWARVSEEAAFLEPWVSFRHAKDLIDSGDSGGAASALQGVLDMPDLESRQYLQAYHFLRELAVDPPAAKAKETLGVVVEVGMPAGVDLVAAYADHHARYFNYSGSGAIWERPDDRLDAVIDDVLKAGVVVARAIGPWKGARPAAPPAGYARISLLTPSGLHFGQGPMDSFSQDRLAGPVLAAAFRLLQQLIAMTTAPRPAPN